jgi:microcystin-dependent protein
MADPFVAEIRIFPFNFAPTGWAFCDGQLMPISQNTALFSLLGTTYGGDGKSTFALPDLQGNVPMHPGQGPGLTLHDLGEQSGVESVTLLQSEIPAHTHIISLPNDTADTPAPGPLVSPAQANGGFVYAAKPSQAQTAQMYFQSLSGAGGSLPHNNMMQYLTLNFCIALQGVYPPRT